MVRLGWWHGRGRLGSAGADADAPGRHLHLGRLPAPRAWPPASAAPGLTLLPVAAWLTGVLELLTEIGGAIGDWAVDLAFSPTMWLGTALGGLAVVLLVVSGFLAKRGGGGTGEGQACEVDRPRAQGAPSGRSRAECAARGRRHRRRDRGDPAQARDHVS